MDKFKKGFTLIELIVVIAIIAILALIAVPSFSAVIERANLSTDESTVRILNTVTPVYRVNLQEPDPFKDSAKTSVELIQILENAEYLVSVVSPKSKNSEFIWDFDAGMWFLIIDGTIHPVYTSPEHFQVHSNDRYQITGYDGNAGSNIIIPGEIDGIQITAITGAGGIGAFQNKNIESIVIPDSVSLIGNHSFRNNFLTAVEIPENIQSIGISAFHDNQITEVVIPDNVSVGASAFHENPVTRITIGEGVTIGDTYSFGINRPGGGNNFDNIYNSDQGGPGTYVFDGSTWVKENTDY